MTWGWKWRSPSILLEGAERFERVEVPVYCSTGGPLFKTLLSSGCRMDCRYCPFAQGVRAPREAWRRDKLVRVFLEAYRRGLVRGLFLSSGLYGDPERVSLDVVEVAEELRRRGYRGYIHLRLMPGTPLWLVREALRLADRVGLNLEAPGPSFFSEIAPSKGRWSLDLLSRLLYAAHVARDPRRVDTQLVLGASGESDRDVIALVEYLAESGVGRVHFSPYTPVRGTPLASVRSRPTPLWRSRQLYEAEVLIRDYGFRAHDFEPILDDEGNIPPSSMQLKKRLALAHPEWFPVNPETASMYELLRVPGIGPKRAQMIVEVRNRGELDLAELRRILGPVWRAAQRFLDLSSLSRSMLTSYM